MYKGLFILFPLFRKQHNSKWFSVSIELSPYGHSQNCRGEPLEHPESMKGKVANLAKVKTLKKFKIGRVDK